MPASITTASQPRSPKCSNAAASNRSKNTAPHAFSVSASSTTVSTASTLRSASAPTRSSSENATGSLPTRMRSHTECKCGDVNVPTRKPSATRPALTSSHTLPLPFVPATCTNASSRSPTSRCSARKKACRRLARSVTDNTLFRGWITGSASNRSTNDFARIFRLFWFVDTFLGGTRRGKPSSQFLSHEGAPRGTTWRALRVKWERALLPAVARGARFCTCAPF
mmetsp:Transcript_27205/g.83523  ORF Transcript_27205/g.83523 Transcript_27205/m.83523 type:complete len:224 (-) Transcript_27205:624-1295(-)